jgi:predicted transposase YdaD
VLAAGLAVLPLAPVSNVAAEKVSQVLLAISDRLARETTPEQAAEFWNATTILMGLRYEKEQIDAIIEGVSTMLYGIRGIEESSVYQDIFRKGRAEGEAIGRAEEAKTALLLQGRQKFGPPDPRIEATIIAISDLDRLHDLMGRLLEVSTWEELLAAEDSSREERP